jgi:hypothetical protein
MSDTFPPTAQRPKLLELADVLDSRTSALRRLPSIEESAAIRRTLGIFKRKHLSDEQLKILRERAAGWGFKAELSASDDFFDAEPLEADDVGQETPESVADGPEQAPAILASPTPPRVKRRILDL